MRESACSRSTTRRPAHPEAAFDFFRLTTGSGGGGGGPAGPSRDDQFDGSTLDTSRWNAIVRGNPSAYSVGGGELTITTEPGRHLHGDTVPPPNNFILQSADHAGAGLDLETKLSGTINGGYGQGGLIAHVDGGNYVKLDAISDAGITRINRIELRSEMGDAVQEPQPKGRARGTTDIWLRLAKSGTTYSGEYSFDGLTWTPIAQTSRTRWPRPPSACSPSARRRTAGRHGLVRLLHARRPRTSLRVQRRR